jgi:TatD DNase family protein
MIDTHAHLYDPIFKDEIEQHVKDIKGAGVSEVWLPNCDLATWGQLTELSEAFPDFVLPMIGLHPTYVKENYLAELAAMAKILDERKLLAIGEIGLDYYWDTTFQNEQIHAFETQCHWAMDKGLWIDVHCRKAYADLLHLLKKPEYEALRGIIHCFSGDAREAKTLVDLGFVLGIGGVITYKNTTLFNDIKDIPLANIVLETDAPYLTPVPHRGQTNSPKFIPLIAQKLADLYEVSVDELIRVTDENANRLKAISGY